MKKALIVLLIVFLSLFSLLLATEVNSFNINHYRRSFDEHNIYESTNKSPNELVGIIENIFAYLKGQGGDELLEKDFNEREILHMQDVRLLFKYGFILKYLSLILSLGIILYFSMKNQGPLIGKKIYKGLFINWALIGILGAMIYLNFNKYFTYFHHIFFTNDLWLLDPKTDLLIQILPEEFFTLIATRIIVSFLIFLATIQVIAYGLVKKGRMANEEEGKPCGD